LRRERIIESFKFYLLAAAYFSRYLERPISGDNSFYPDEPQELEKYFQYSHNLYDRLCMLDPEEISFVRNKLCQQIIDEYDLEPKWIDRFFKQPFDLLLRRPETLI